MGLRERTLWGIAWSLAEQFARRGVGVVVTLLLAYLVSPAAFGLVAMITVFIEVATKVMDGGFREAIIRKEGVTAEELDTAFVANVGLGVFGCLCLMLSADAIAAFYGEPALAPLVRVLSLSVPLQSLQVVQFATLSRALDFRSQMAVSFPSSLLSGAIAVVAAFLGAGVWSLVIQRVVMVAMASLLIWRVSDWRYNWGPTWAAFWDLFGFGSRLIVAALIGVLFDNAFVVVFGKLFGAAIAGHYFFAHRIRTLLLSQLVAALQKVTYPALASIQSDVDQMREAYKQMILATTFVVAPVLLMFAALAEPLFQAVLHERWLPAVPMLQLLCVGGLAYPLHAINLNVVRVSGRGNLFLGLSLVKRAMFVAMVVVTYSYGVLAMVAGQAVVSILSFIPNSYYSKELLQYGSAAQVRDVTPIVLLSLGVALPSWWASAALDWPPVAEVVVLGIASVIGYLAGAWLLRVPALRQAVRLASRLRRRSAS